MASLTQTGQQIITGALTTLGVVPQGGSPSPSDSADGLNELNNMTNGWNGDNGLIYSVAPVLVAAPSTNGGTALASSLARIFSAEFVDGSGRRWPLRIVDQKTYRSHFDLSASSSVASEELFWDPNGNPGQIYTWPVVNISAQISLDAGAQWAPFTLGGAVVLPPTYADALNYGLAQRMISRFADIVTPQIQQWVISQAKLSLDRVREMNAANRVMPSGASANPAQVQDSLTQPQIPRAA